VANAEFKVILTIDSQGNAKIEEVKKGLQDVGAAAQNANQQGAASADDFASSLVRQLGIYALVTAAAYKLEQAVVGGFKAGIETVDDYRVQVIGIAAQITNMAEAGQGSYRELFQRGETYASEMYRAITVEAAKHFASSGQMMTTYNRLVQSGYVVRLDEVAAMGLLTDRIMLATKGQNTEMQLNTEIMALMSGQVRQGSLIAMELQSRVGPEWKKLVESHREAGDLLAWLASMWPGLGVATKEVENTLMAQKNTLLSQLQLLAIGGLGGAYADIVDLLKQANDFLREHKNLAYGIVVAWETGKGSILVVKDEIQNIHTEIKQIMALSPVKITIDLIANFIDHSGGGIATSLLGGFFKGALKGGVMGGFADMGVSGLQRLWEGSPEYESQNGTSSNLRDILSMQRIAEAKAGAKLFPIGGQMVPMDEVVDLPQTKKGLRDTEGGGGKSTDSALNSMQSLMDRLQQDIARLSEGGIAAVDAWYDKTMHDIAKLVAKGADGAEAEALAWQAAGLKKGKIEEDFWLKMAKESGNAYAGIEAQAQDWLKKHEAIQGAAAQIEEWRIRKTWEADIKNSTERLGLEKSLVDQAAQLSPLVADQVAWKRKGLELDIEIQRYAEALKLNKLELAGIISRTQADELRGMQAILDQQKRYNFEMEHNKGLAGWAYSRGKEADQRSTVKEMMGGLESGFQNAFSSSLQGVLAQDKKTLQNIGKTMWQGFSGEINKASITTLFGKGAQLFRQQGPQGLSGTGDATGKSAAQLSQAAKELQKGGHLGVQAGMGFNLNTAQFGLAAGGLLLSGIGIMTNSQALVMAGTVLQVAAMAIQLYEALTSTTTMMEMTVAAGALTASAGELGAAGTLLLMVAMKQAIPIIGHTGLELPRFHSGDEIPAILQRGEWVLRRDAVTSLKNTYGPDAFARFNSGQVPAMPVPMGRGGSGDSAPAPAPIMQTNHFNFNARPTLYELRSLTAANLRAAHDYERRRT
jgi:hypothetical protein